MGSLRYLCSGGPDIAFCVGLINRFMDNPRLSHMEVVKRILRYLKGIIDFGVLSPKGILEEYRTDWILKF